MPMPFQCIYCGKPISQPMNGVCDKCEEEQNDG